MLVSREAMVRGFTTPHSPDPVGVRRRIRLQRTAFIGICWALSLVAFGLGYSTIKQVWPTDFMGDFLDNIIIPVALPFTFFPVLLLGFAKIVWRSLDAQEGMLLVLPVRRAVLDGRDTGAPVDHVAPIAVAQWAALTSTDLVAGPSKWGPLKPPPDERGLWLLLLGFILLLGGGCVLLAIFISGLPLQTEIASSALPALVLIFGAALLWRSLLIDKAVTVTADDWGLRWNHRRWWGISTRQSLAWSDVRAFMVITVDEPAPSWNLPLPPQRMFVLDAESSLFAWMVPGPKHRHALEAHERFLRLVATRVHVPLRDPSAAIRRVTLEPATSVPGQTHQYGTSGAVGWTQYLAGPPQILGLRARLRFAFQLLVVPLALYVILIGGTWALKTIELHHFTVLTTLGSQTPLTRKLSLPISTDSVSRIAELLPRVH